MKLNILISLVVLACTLTLTACSTTQQSKVSTRNPITEDANTSTEESATGIHSSDCYEAVDSTLSDLCKSDEFINATDDEKAELAWSTSRRA